MRAVMPRSGCRGWRNRYRPRMPHNDPTDSDDREVNNAVVAVETGRRGQRLICEGWFASHAVGGTPGPHLHLRTSDAETPVLRTEQLPTLIAVAGAGFEPAKEYSDGFTDRNCPRRDLRFRRSPSQASARIPHRRRQLRSGGEPGTETSGFRAWICEDCPGPELDIFAQSEGPLDLRKTALEQPQQLGVAYVAGCDDKQPSRRSDQRWLLLKSTSFVTTIRPSRSAMSAISPRTAVRQTSSFRSDPMTVSGQSSCPPARSFVAVSG